MDISINIFNAIRIGVSTEAVVEYVFRRARK
jgi:hypothetical protein